MYNMVTTADDCVLWLKSAERVELKYSHQKRKTCEVINLVINLNVGILSLYAYIKHYNFISQLYLNKVEKSKYF